jgi:hypothetical protein
LELYNPTKPIRDEAIIAGQRLSTDIEERDGGKYIKLALVAIGGDIDGREYKDEICYENDDAETQADGQKRLAELGKAAGRTVIDDSNELLYAVVEADFANTRPGFSYFPPAAAAA